MLDQGVRRFAVGLGAASTNDGGAGMLMALGLSLQDATTPLRPDPTDLQRWPAPTRAH
jgi:glycerate kinase